MADYFYSLDFIVSRYLHYLHEGVNIHYWRRYLKMPGDIIDELANEENQ